jgi:hypothetical protein
VSKSNKTRISASIPIETKKKLDTIADERGVSRSAALTELVGEWEKYRDELDATRSEVEQLRGRLQAEQEKAEQVTPTSRDASTVGLLATALGPVLLAVGQGVIAVPFLVVGAVYVLLWATGYEQYADVLIAEGHAELAEHGGLRGFFRAVFLGDPVIDDPSTVFERAANADRYVPIVSLAALVVALPVWGAYEAGALSAFVETLGVWGALGYILLLTGVLYLIPVIAGVAAIASLAVATARTPTDDTPTPEREGA